MGLFGFGKKADPSLDQASLECIVCHDQKIEFVIDSAESEKYCSLNDLLSFFQATFRSHKAVFSVHGKEVKKIISQAKKAKQIRKFMYLKYVSTGQREKTDFYPLVLFLPLFNVGLMSADEVESLNSVLRKRLNMSSSRSSVPIAPLAPTAAATAKKDGVDEDERSVTPVEIITGDIGTPTNGGNNLVVDTQLLSFNENNSSTFSPMPGSLDTEVKEQANSDSANTVNSKAEKKKKKLKKVVELNLKEIEENYMKINLKFESMIAENKALLVSPRPLQGVDDLPSDQQSEKKDDAQVDTGAADDGWQHQLKKQEQFLADRKAKRLENKNEIVSLLEARSEEVLSFPMPAWRHKLAGNNNPAPAMVLRGKSLFRVAAMVVLHFYAKPILNVRRRRREGKNVMLKEFSQSTKLFFDICSSWVGKKVQIPLSSILKVLIHAALSHHGMTLSASRYICYYVM